MGIDIKNKVKVLHVFGSLNRGGAETLIMNVFRNIDKSMYKFDFAVQTSEKGEYEDEVLGLGGKVYHLNSPRQSTLRFMSEFNRLLQSESYDVVHSHIYNFSGITLTIARQNNVPVRIAHSHNTSDGKEDNLYRKIYRRIMRNLILVNATHLIGCSDDACKALFGDKKENKYQIINNGIDLTPYYNLVNGIKTLSYESPVIGHIGSFTKQKNHKFIIQVFQELLKKKPSAKLILIGTGPLKEEIENKVRTLNIINNVHFLGSRSDIPQLLSDMDAFLFPSFFEGLGIALVEAQAAGLPCLISNKIPEEVDMGLNLVNRMSLREDPEKWAEKLLEMIKDTKSIDVNKCLIDINKRGYNIENTILKLKQIYSNC